MFRHTDAQSDPSERRGAVRDIQRIDRCQHAPGYVERAVRVGVRQQDHEFVATVARGKVCRALQRLADGLADLGQAVVAGAMPMVIVVGLEVVDIDEQHCQRPVVPTRAFPFRGANDVEVAAVMETGERVGDGERTQLVLQAPVLLQLLTQAPIDAIEATCDPDDHRQDECGDCKHPQQPAQVRRLRGLVDQSAHVDVGASRCEAEFAVHVEDVLPAADVRVAELYEIRAHQRHHAVCLEAQFLHRKVGCVLRVNECGDLLLMRESVLPAAQTRRAECLGPFRVPGHHCAGGEQRVTVEVHAAGARRELAVLPTRLLQVVALVGLVARERVDAPLHQGVHAVVMLHELQSVDRYLLALQVGEYFGFPWRERHLVAREVMHGIDAGVAPHEQGEW